MKKITAILTLMLSFSSFAALPKFINCENEKGLEMEVRLTDLEATRPIYYVTLTFKGSPYKKFQAFLKENSSSRMMLEAYAKDDKVINVGLEYSNNEAFYQESANNGMSPLPGSFFSECAVR